MVFLVIKLHFYKHLMGYPLAPEKMISNETDISPMKKKLINYFKDTNRTVPKLMLYIYIEKEDICY